MSYKKNIILSIILFVFAIIMLFPIFWTITTSLKTSSEIQNPEITIMPDNYDNVENYMKVIEENNFLTMVWNSIKLCLITLLFTVFLSALAGYGFAKFDFRFKEALYFINIGVLMVPFQSVAVPLYKTFNAVGLNDTFIGLALPLLVSAFGIVIMRESISAIPNDYISAARLDGLSELGIFFKIILPMVKPAIVAIVIIKFMLTWNELLWPLIIIESTKNYTVTLGLAEMTNIYMNPYETITAALTISLAPIFVIYILLRKWMIKTLSGTGLKI